MRISWRDRADGSRCSEGVGLTTVGAETSLIDRPGRSLTGEGADGSRRILFVSSAGGHLSQLLQLEPWWRHHDRRWVTFDLPDARSKLEGEALVPAFYPTTRNLVNMIRNFRLARRMLDEWQPDVIISNGAGTAVPFFIEANRRGIPTVYLEVYDRIDSRTLTGRMVRRFTTQFCVQWPEQQMLYRDSTLVGPLY